MYWVTVVDQGGVEASVFRTADGHTHDLILASVETVCCNDLDLDVNGLHAKHILRVSRHRYSRSVSRRRSPIL